MSELEDRLNAVLSDPEQMARISRLAQSLMGGTAPSPSGDGQVADPVPAQPAEAASGLPFDSEMLGRLGALMNGAQGSELPQQAALRALLPALKPRRRERLERAMRLAHVASAAKKMGLIPFSE